MYKFGSRVNETIEPIKNKKYKNKRKKRNKQLNGHKSDSTKPTTTTT